MSENSQQIQTKTHPVDGSIVVHTKINSNEPIQKRYKQAIADYVSKKGNDTLSTLMLVYKGKFEMMYKLLNQSYHYKYDIDSSIENGSFENEKTIWMDFINDLETFVVM